MGSHIRILEKRVLPDENRIHLMQFTGTIRSSI
jgi:hypothetical protein